MVRDDRIAILFLILSMLLHVALLVPLPLLQLDKAPQPDEQPRVRYVVHIPQAARTPTPVAVPATPNPSSRLAAPPAVAVEPRTAQPFEISQVRQEPTPAPQAPPLPIKVVNPKRADRPVPRQPTTIEPQATTVRHQKVAPLPQIAQAPVQPPGEETVKRILPRQPSSQGQEAVTPRPPGTAADELNPLTAYLAEVRAAIDRQKRFPAAARRPGLSTARHQQVSNMGGMFPHVMPVHAGIQAATGPRLSPG